MDAQVDDDGEVAVVNPVRVARDRFMAAVGQAAGGAAFVVQVGANDGRMGDPVYSIAKRDAADSGRKNSPLMVAEGATVLDTSDHSIESAVEAAMAILKQQGLAIAE